MAELVIWPAGHSDWFSCSPDQITWLDRPTLSAGRDPTLHRPPRCPGLRHVHYRWELFSRDTTHAVYLAPYKDGSPGHFKEVQAEAVSTLPPVPKLLSGKPEAVYRSRAKSTALPSRAATRIFPSGCTATARPLPLPGTKTIPP